jgi:hypothetical protein
MGYVDQLGFVHGIGAVVRLTVGKELSSAQPTRRKAALESEANIALFRDFALMPLNPLQPVSVLAASSQGRAAPVHIAGDGAPYGP